MNKRRNVLAGCLRFSSITLGGLLVVAADVHPASAAGAVIKVACIGEQTTHSDLFPSRTNQPVGMQEYPAMLQTLAGSGYNVMNFGDCCASVISGYASSETHPFISGNQFGPSQSFAPDIVIIGSWGRHDWGMSAQTALPAFMAGDTATAFTKFQTDYDTLVSKYIALANKPKIFCSTPVPIPFGNDGPDDGYKTSPAADAVKAVCGKYNLPIIDLFTVFTGHKEYYINPPLKDSDGEHSSPAGAMVIAQTVLEAITGVDAGGIVVSGGSSGGSGGGSGGMGKADASLGGTGSDDSGIASGGSSSGGVVPAGSSGGASGSGGVIASGSGSSGGVGVGSSSSGAPGVDTGPSTGTDTGTGTGTSGAQPVEGTAAHEGSSGCSLAKGGDGRRPWDGAMALVAGWALLSRRRSGRQCAKKIR